MIKELLSIFYPRICPGCSQPILSGEVIVCTDCISTLPLRKIEKYTDQSMIKNLAGRLDVESCFSLLRFTKGSTVQNLLHALKYKNRPDVGFELGRILGSELVRMGWISRYNLIVPVPLHIARLRSRGYNQSEQFAKGLGEVLDIELDTESLLRTQRSATQTYKNRIERMKNVSGIFSASHHLKGKSVLLVDDVFTTGATIEACGNALIDVGINNLGIATIAHAEF